MLLPDMMTCVEMKNKSYLHTCIHMQKGENVSQTCKLQQFKKILLICL
jgi:hypothetical protein